MGLIYLILILIIKKHKISNLHDLNVFNKIYGDLFIEFKQDHISQWLYYLMLCIRRLILISLYFVIDNGTVQLIVSLIVSFIVRIM